MMAAMNLLCKTIVAAIVLPAALQSALADELKPQEALQQYARSVELVKTYDVTVSVTVTNLFRNVIEQRDGKRVGHLEPVLADEKPFTRTTTSREVGAGNKTFRAECYDPRTKSTTLLVF